MNFYFLPVVVWCSTITRVCMYVCCAHLRTYTHMHTYVHVHTCKRPGKRSIVGGACVKAATPTGHSGVCVAPFSALSASRERASVARSPEISHAASLPSLRLSRVCCFLNLRIAGGELYAGRDFVGEIFCRCCSCLGIRFFFFLFFVLGGKCETGLRNVKGVCETFCVDIHLYFCETTRVQSPVTVHI